MNYKTRKIFLTLVLLVAVLTACSPSYHPEPNAPDTTTAPADKAYVMDFVQINNDIIEYYSQENILKYFPFITDLDIDGSNDPAQIDLKISVEEKVSDEAILIILSDIAKNIGDEAAMQDFRLKDSSDTSFGTVYDYYAFHYTVEVNGEVYAEDTIAAGQEFTLDPKYDLAYLKDYLAESKAKSEAAATEQVETQSIDAK